MFISSVRKINVSTIFDRSTKVVPPVLQPASFLSCCSSPSSPKPGRSAHNTFMRHRSLLNECVHVYVCVCGYSKTAGRLERPRISNDMGNLWPRWSSSHILCVFETTSPEGSTRSWYFQRISLLSLTYTVSTWFLKTRVKRILKNARGTTPLL